MRLALGCVLDASDAFDTTVGISNSLIVNLISQKVFRSQLPHKSATTYPLLLLI